MSSPRGRRSLPLLPWKSPLPTMASRAPRTVGFVPYTLLRNMILVAGRQLLTVCLHPLDLPSWSTSIGLKTLLGAEKWDTRHLKVWVLAKVDPSCSVITDPVIFGGFRSRTSLFVRVVSRERPTLALPLHIFWPTLERRR